MKKVLIVTYFFPPVGGMPVMRTLKFAKFLPENGWIPYILTVRDSDYYYRDERLVQKIPAEAKVYQTRYFDPVGFYKRITRSRVETEDPSKGTALPEIEIKEKGIRWLLKTIANYIFIPDGYIGWLPFALTKGLSLIKNEKIDIIYTTAPPWTCHLIGLCLRWLTGKLWVADFRDLWTEREIGIRNGFPRKIEEILERKVLENADRVITVVDSCRDEILKKFPGRDFPKKFVVIHNGFDLDDFQGVKGKGNFQKFTITHTGTVWPPGILRGLLTALNQVPQDIRSDIELFFLGGLYQVDRELVDKSGLDELVRLKPFVPHDECLSYQLGSDVLLLLLRSAIEGETALSGKFFEYLVAKKPILAIVPPNGAAAELIKKTKTGIVVHSEDVQGIREAILNLYEKYKNATLDLGKQSIDNLKQFDRRELTKKLAKIFNELTA